MSGAKKIYSVDEIKDKLSPLFKDEGLQLTLLFGSAASGRVYSQSDIDLGFLYDGPVNILDLTNKVIRLLQNDRIDVIDLQRASPLLKFSAAQQGKLLFERTPGLFNSFYSLAFRRYMDTKKMREAQGNTIKQFLEEKGLI